MSYPAEYRMTARQGSTFTKRLTWRVERTPVDLSGWTARMQVRESADSPDVIIELTTSNGRITLGGDEGTIDLEISAADTADLEPSNYVYDLEMVNTAEVTAILAGRFVVSPEVTR